MGFNYPRTQNKAHKLILKYGMTASLKRGTDLRDVIVAEVDFTPEEKRTLVNPTDRLFLLSSKDLAIPPDHQKDVLVTYKQPAADPPVTDETLRIVKEPGRLAPAGIVVYYELQVRA